VSRGSPVHVADKPTFINRRKSSPKLNHSPALRPHPSAVDGGTSVVLHSVPRAGVTPRQAGSVICAEWGIANLRPCPDPGRMNLSPSCGIPILHSSRQS